MITFLWMLYLAFLIFTTVSFIYFLNVELVKRATKQPFGETSDMTAYTCVIASILWSIWYMYFLH